MQFVIFFDNYISHLYYLDRTVITGQGLIPIQSLNIWSFLFKFNN